MADHDPLPDPIDRAYLQAETLLGDEADRQARRARILGAVAQEQPGTPTSVARSSGRSRAQIGGWLVAASVVGLGVFIAVQGPPLPTRTAAPPPTPAAPAASMAPATASAPVKTAPPQPLDSIAAPPKPPLRAAPQRETEQARAEIPAPPPAVVAPNIPAPPPLFAKPIEAPRVAAPATAPAAPMAGLAAKQSLENDYRVGVRKTLAPDLAGKLRDAAADGQVEEVQALLDRGVPVDAADADGDTALMKSIEADRPDVAALLRQRGASLDKRNRDGQSARGMAEAADDPALKQAIGLPPP